MMARMIRNFQDQVDELRDRVMGRIRKEMPESGDFADILELFDNLDEPTQCYVGKYGMRVYKMPRYADADPRKRYVEIAAYVPSGEYKADMIVASGTRDEILLKLCDAEFIDQVCSQYGKLLDMIRWM